MPHKELIRLIIDGETDAAYDLFLQIVRKEGLWRKAFSRGCLLARYESVMLGWAFVHLCEKIKNRKIKDVEYLHSINGVIVITLRETYRAYVEDIQIDIAKIEKINYDGDIEGVNPFEEIEEKKSLEKLRQKIDDNLGKLGEICRSIIIYKYIENLEHKEIVQRIDRIGSEGASRVRLSQCMEKLRKLLKD